ncbi:Dihydropteroate synthase [Sulfurivirga caldicuralii]|uniref:Dihydropteroate synthase n=1 Tax=Sulfurivirga caldicuralii TaxID=364032 RepID=A0A1N6ET68_9GAMM|nr:dihydropteroate synthase [Sulfurivirga caldicuralii]SIN86144.1 Dihydropteroate synthase [Sulfurivirga caldicuralii]
MNRFQALLRSEPLDRALVMGILNVTPDSFSDGGRWTHEAAIRQHATEMAAAGADLIDIGGESTRPGAEPVSLEEELARVIPAIKWVRAETNLPISVDTSKPEVMAAALEAGADMINDVNALQAPGALDVVREAMVPVCLMHRQGTPQTMQDNPVYTDVVADVEAFLLARAQAVQAETGLDSSAIWLDPGFGFGKTLEHNQALFSELDTLVDSGYPVLVGVSRKRMIGELLGGAPIEERVCGSVSAAVLAALKGASVVRVHDVKETVDALTVAMALL